MPAKAVPPATPTPVRRCNAAQGAEQRRAGGGPTGGRGTDVATVRTEGVDFPFPGYLENIVRQIAKNFGEHRNTNAARRSTVPHPPRRLGERDLVLLLAPATTHSTSMRRARSSRRRNATRFGPLPNGFSDDVLPVIFSFDPTVVH